jgi:hypothetical protein
MDAPAERLSAAPQQDLTLDARPYQFRTPLEPGTYQISGIVRLEQSSVQIAGLSHNQWVSWGGVDRPEQPVASFTAFEQLASPGMIPAITVRGGRLESLTVVPIDVE